MMLVAVMVRPCALPPPFNTHHAENLSLERRGRPSWRKLGRKLGRPGLNSPRWLNRAMRRRGRNGRKIPERS